MKAIIRILAIILMIQGFAEHGHAQYFGRNKPRYRGFEFKVVSSPHFDLYHYLKDKNKANEFATMAEQWYQYHSSIIGDSISFKNPVILYNNHAEFQQTNAISGSIGVGTGGVTEAFKNRVVLPLTFSNQTNWQVLGHELVHAFQFHTILYGDSTSIQSLSNLPLWMVEGMAEYMSLGRVDPFTSMWMRDAILNNEVPTLMKMDNPKYFPYRYGQAFWSFLTGVYGDKAISPLFRNTAMYTLPVATEQTLNISLENLSNMWENGIKNNYEPYLKDKKEKPEGKLLFSEENSGTINVCPSISPNGRYVVFLSEKDLFSTDLYLADARTGKIINKVSSLIKDSDLDHLNFLESSGTWSPDGKDFAFVGFKKGRNVLVIKDADAGKTLQTLNIPGVDAFTSPAWSPIDKNTIVVSGITEGQVDLYAFNIRTKKVVQLTNDKYSEILANFSDDGSRLTFSYDKRSVDEGRKNGAFTYDIAIMNMLDKSIEVPDVFHGAENINPNFDHEGNILFISERDGFRNMYKYNVTDKKVYQLTNILTGISGITRYSPAITVSTKRDKIMYTHYWKNGYNIYEVSASQLEHKEVDATAVNLEAGTLPGWQMSKKDIVSQNLNSADNYVSTTSLKDERYKPKFKLDYIGGGTGIGVGNNNLGNSVGLQGGINMLFSDMLGNHQIFTMAALNGEILDFGGQVAYLNRTHRIAWGLGFSHIPLRAGYQEFYTDKVDNFDVVVSETNIIRIFDKSLSAFAQYPFSTTLRLEAGLSGSHRGFRQDLYRDYYDPNTFYYLGSDDRERVETGETLRFNDYYTVVRGYGGTANVALVGDNSFFGLTSPLAGYRYRLGIDKSFGADDYWSIIADYRKYFWMKPFSFAVRGTGITRFEKNVNSVFPYYIGNMGFVRGYGSIWSTEIIDELGLDFNQLLGSKMGIISAEVRMPFTGPKQLALIGSNYFLSDLVVFFDAGVAFDDFKHFNDGETMYTVLRDENGNPEIGLDGNPVYALQNLKPTIAKSIGLAMRVNLLGAYIIEPYYARQLQDKGRWTFGLNLVPGW